MDEHWLTELKTANADTLEEFFERDDLPDVEVETQLNRLRGDDGGLARTLSEKPLRSVLFIAHAGDGKSHFFQRVEAGSPESETVFRYDERLKDLTDAHSGSFSPEFEPGLHIFNDPSKASLELAKAFFERAFDEKDLREHPDVRFLAGINRGKLRDLLRLFDKDSDAASWLRKALRFHDDAHRGGDHGRLAVPLDKRVLVPAPGDELGGGSLAGRLARNILSAVADETAGTSHEFDQDTWIKRIEVSLALVEACGHHVTFREATVLTAAVGEKLYQGHRGEALSTLFQFRQQLEPLSDAAKFLRRIDPARSATPAADLAGDSSTGKDLPARDTHIRSRGVDALVALFESTDNANTSAFLPYRFSVEFLDRCQKLGTKVEDILDLKARLRRLRGDDGPSNPDHFSGRLRKFEDEIREEGVRVGVPDAFFNGLAQFAWGPRAESDDAIVPLTSPLQAGGRRDNEGWRVMRGAIGNRRAFLKAETHDYGPFIERGFELPSLVFDGPEQLGESPGLPLDLELFERISRMSEPHSDSRALGRRKSQVLTWLDSVVSDWEQSLMKSVEGLVVFETLLGDSGEAPVALQPSKRGPESAGFDKNRTRNPGVISVHEALTEFWPPPGSTGNQDTIAITPAACASALLEWAGFTPRRKNGELPGDTEQSHPALRQAAGADTVKRLRTRTNLISPAFPWSDCMLGLGFNGSSTTTYDNGPRLGAACARALGLHRNGDYREWAALLRGTWAGDEAVFDTHPASRFCHQWLGLPLKGLQLERWDDTHARPAANDLSARVLSDLLMAERPAFSPPERWWLIGTWAAWWLMLAGLDELHELDGQPIASTPERPPVLVPKQGNSYGSFKKDCFLTDRDRHDGERDAVLAVGQASGFLRPQGKLTTFDLDLDGPVEDLIRLVAWSWLQHEESGTSQKTPNIEALQSALKDAGLFTLSNGNMGDIRAHLPEGVLNTRPGSTTLNKAFELKLESLGMKLSDSDGEELFRSPWQESTQ